MPSSDARGPDSPDADDKTDEDDEREKTILDRLVDVLWILPW
ncbi:MULTISPECIES: hypothetical protein [Haloferax]|uniref:Uncharacterized protein n=1 Tax=Haloferax massiliensis TaxID=1476858 RepID=A0A0D6JSH0_9EURY|nr:MULTISPECIES: hypothetical protein [Haloferax]CQR50846.1 hypothetical protein BN996_02330 [Haloferax massiliensis]